MLPWPLVIWPPVGPASAIPPPPSRIAPLSSTIRQLDISWRFLFRHRFQRNSSRPSRRCKFPNIDLPPGALLSAACHPTTPPPASGAGGIAPLPGKIAREAAQIRKISVSIVNYGDRQKAVVHDSLPDQGTNPMRASFRLALCCSAAIVALAATAAVADQQIGSVVQKDFNGATGVRVASTADDDLIFERD